MKITQIAAYNLDIPYDVQYRPAWQPGLIGQSRDFTPVRMATDAGIVGCGGSDGHHVGTIARNVTPHLLGADPFAMEAPARSLRHSGGLWLWLWFIDLAFWEIIGKAAGLPLDRLWGAARDKVQPCAGTAELGDPANRAGLAARDPAAGLRATQLRFQLQSSPDPRAGCDTAGSSVSNTP